MCVAKEIEVQGSTGEVQGRFRDKVMARAGGHDDAKVVLCVAAVVTLQ
jgi:hypothetical protein